jgi:CheY-like chemotaxis protein
MLLVLTFGVPAMKDEERDKEELWAELRSLQRTERMWRETEPEGWNMPATGGGETILLVDDEPSVLKMTKRVLEEMGYIVLAAGTAREAIRLAGEHASEIHLLLTDVVMPGMNGRDLAENLLTLYPHLKYLLMSGYTANIIGHEGALGAGVNFIEKPFSMQDLSVKLRQVLCGNDE